MSYDLHSPFNIADHKRTYINYLEVIIDRNGKVMYAVPSHQKRLEQLAAEERGCTVEDIQDMCPPDMYFDYMNWLISLTDSVAVWNDYELHGDNVSLQQCAKLSLMKRAGIYRGPLIRRTQTSKENSEYE